MTNLTEADRTGYTNQATNTALDLVRAGRVTVGDVNGVPDCILVDGVEPTDTLRIVLENLYIDEVIDAAARDHGAPVAAWVR